MLQERHSKCNVKIVVNKELEHFNYNVIWTLYMEGRPVHIEPLLDVFHF